MNTLHPIPDCPMPCAFRNTDLCVCNLIAVYNDKTPISYGLHVGLGSFYGSQALPPCVRGPLGSAHWSIAADAEAAPQPGEAAAVAEAAEQGNLPPPSALEQDPAESGQSEDVRPCPLS